MSGVFFKNRDFWYPGKEGQDSLQPRAGRCIAAFLRNSLLLVIACDGCRQPADDYDPCSVALQLEVLQPSTLSFQWVPYPPQAHLVFVAEQDTLLLRVTSEDGPPCEPTFGNFDILCPNDSSQNRRVNYQSLARCFELSNADELSEFRSVEIALRAWLDERRSTIDRLLLSDVMEVSFVYAKGARRNILRFPVLDRGFGDVFTNEFRFDPVLVVNGKRLEEVYHSAASDPEEDAYYTPSGLAAIRHRGKVFLLQ